MFASVCRHWRIACLGSPLLWRRIGPDAYNLNLIALLVERSQNSPLIISYHISYHDKGREKQILSLLALHCERWEDVTLTIRPSSLVLLSSIKGRLPLLASLTWGLCESDLELESTKEFSGFEIAPALQRSHFLPPCPKELISVPWVQLTDLTFEQISASDLYSILRHTPNLCFLFLRIVLGNTATLDPSPEETLNKLTSLHVTECGTQVLHSLLRISPNIISLRIIVADNQMYTFCMPFRLLLPCLQTLHIEVYSYSERLGRIIWVEAPVLSELVVHGCCVSDDDEDDEQDVAGPPGPILLHFLMNFVEEARCRPASLQLLLEVDFDPIELASFLHTLPCLELLDITTLHGLQSMPFRKMIPAAQVFPRLQIIRLRVPDYEQYTLDDLNDLITFAKSSVPLKVELIPHSI
ncbi:hypothetical protein EV360DRAFT_73521 [Lentinula raphanica]|nr:hypothetical protein EV360DRAFT_73521 [Lentinula raphanica]